MSALLVGQPDDGGFRDGGVLQQARLDLGGRDPDAAGLEQVVAAAQAGVVPGGRADVGVAGAEPLAGEHGAARVGAPPVAQRDGLAADEQRPRFAVRDEPARGVAQLEVVARDAKNVGTAK